MKTRIFRAPNSRYYAEEVLDGPDVYTHGVLGDIRSHGFTDIWLRLRLRDAAQTSVYRDLGHQAAQYRAALNTLCERAAGHSLGVYLYLNEPLGFPAEHVFWQLHPDERGASGSSGMDGWERTNAMCTSHPAVRLFLREAVADVFRHSPQLAGVFTITASEHHTHCYSHNMDGTLDCARCRDRTVADVVAEVNNLIRAGITEAGSDANLIAWAWGWSAVEPDGWRDVMGHLQRNVAVMADFEIGGHKVILGRERIIDEYSLSYVGPSEQFAAMRSAAELDGREVFAKLQIGTTHEMATVNNLPLIPNLLGKARWLRDNDVAGSLLCWNFGNRLTLNTWAFNHYMDDSELGAKKDYDALSEVARAYLGVDDTDPVLAAWDWFVKAFDFYPFHLPLLYSSPVNYAPVYPLARPDDPDRPMQWTWIPLTRPFGTRLMPSAQAWGRSNYTLDEIRDSFREMDRLFEIGLEAYRVALSGSTSELAQRELRNAEVIHHVLRSTANIYSAYSVAHASPFDEAAWLTIARDEAQHLTDLLPVLAGETEIGYHSEACSWFFTERDVRKKIEDLEQICGRVVSPTAAIRQKDR